MKSWRIRALGKTAEGIKMYDYLTRMGRSLYTGCIFNGHSVLDLPTEAIKNTITYKFCFCTTNENEARRMCEYLGLEASEQNKAAIMNLQNGECMFQDMDKHVGILRFDAVFQDIVDVFSTTPKAKKEDAEQGKEEEIPDMDENMFAYDFSYDDDNFVEENVPKTDVEEAAAEILEPEDADAVNKKEETDKIQAAGKKPAKPTQSDGEVDMEKIIRNLMKKEAV